MKLYTSLLFVAAVLVATPAQAQTTADLVARMQAIIEEMQALQAEFESLTAASPTTDATPTTQPSGSVLGAATTVLQEEAVYGNTNDTIMKLQTLLATDPLIYPDGTVSGFFGPKTQEAVRNLQARFGLDPVGVVGPATAELVMEYFVTYPGGAYPDDVLSSRPLAATAQAVTAAQTTQPDPTPTPIPSRTTSVNSPIDEIFLTRDDGETVIRVVMRNGDATGLAVDSSEEDDIVDAIVRKLDVTEGDVRAVLDMTTLKPSRGGDYDEDEAEDMIEDAEDAIDDAKDAIEEADDDGKDVDDAEDLLEEAEEDLEKAEEAFDDRDYDDAYEHAKDARNQAKDAEDEAEDSGVSEDDAEDKIDDAKDAIDDAEDVIDEAKDDGKDVDEAEELLEEAEDELDDAEDEFDDGDYDKAFELAKDAIELAEEAEDEV